LHLFSLGGSNIPAPLSLPFSVMTGYFIPKFKQNPEQFLICLSFPSHTKLMLSVKGFGEYVHVKKSDVGYKLWTKENICFGKCRETSHEIIRPV
jgi:hypothetical protein